MSMDMNLELINAFLEGPIAAELSAKKEGERLAERKELADRKAKLLAAWDKKRPGLEKAWRAKQQQTARKEAELKEAESDAVAAYNDLRQEEPNHAVDQIDKRLRETASPQIERVLEVLEGDFESVRRMTHHATVKNPFTGTESVIGDQKAVNEWVGQLPETRERIRALALEPLDEAQIAKKIEEIRRDQAFPGSEAEPPPAA